MEQDAGGLMGLLPFLIITITMSIFVWFIARRKGVNAPLYCVLTVIPLVGIYTVVFLLSKTDKDVLERLEKLEGMDTH